MTVEVEVAFLDHSAAMGREGAWQLPEVGGGRWVGSRVG